MDKTGVFYFREQNGPIDLSLKSVTENRVKKWETKYFRNANNLREKNITSVQDPTSTKWPKIASFNGAPSAVSSSSVQPQEFRGHLITENSNIEDIQEQMSQTPFILSSSSVPFVCDALLRIPYPKRNLLPVETSGRNNFQKLSSVENDEILDRSSEDESRKAQEGNVYSCYPDRRVVQQCDSRSSSRNSKSDSNTFNEVFCLTKNDLLNVSESSLPHSNRVNGENSYTAKVSQTLPNRCEHDDVLEEEELPEDLSVNNSHRRLEEFVSIALRSENIRSFTGLRRSASFCSFSSNAMEQERCHALDRSRSKSDSETPSSSPNFKTDSSLWSKHSLRDKDFNRNLMGSRSCSISPENDKGLLRNYYNYYHSPLSQNISNSLRNPKPLVTTVAKHSTSLTNRGNNYCDPSLVNPSDFSTLESVNATSLVTSNDKNTLLKKLRQITPSGYPWNVYGYYTYLMQMYHNHEAITGTPAEVKSTFRLSPSPACTPQFLAASSPKQDNLPVEDENVNGAEKKQNRILTGKHVKYGTGASPSTLLTLRQKIQERQRAKELAEINEVFSNGKIVETGKKRNRSALFKTSSAKDDHQEKTRSGSKFKISNK
ncbi:uncharacterized protein LOC111087520 [Limulus polyphemus]|uniref:Uncharacterized protein LOC111087520 n=1 Tax=Limulus polyphemus TaxID=6850 RepID=A0ABM1T2M3_LIMPO|nr:uncharacterized protein LOC111087520 [Limulus polyphemus]XP_022250129.1 uncharacterized protein LOC111087520 [Limulus polyphemus]XP_022250130.1 uncharacterized protein LOC111087520 [Limulus polyphemus]XP_022250131.1 uncharacterized protein LOC111087520 [Limulus polyphemus]XP_022250132.1 uncharacterized protein LOC111087520 [Limulus polyphemus]